MNTTLTDALGQRAERGARRTPAAVIAAARSGRVGADESAHDRLTLVGDDDSVPAVGPHGAIGRRRPVVLATAAAVSALLGLGALALHAGRTGRTELGVGGAPAEPQLPLTLVDTARSAAVDRCVGDWAPSATIVDHRAAGLFVGLVKDDMYKLCIYPVRPTDSGAMTGSSTSPVVRNDQPADPAVVFPDGRASTDPPVSTERFVWGRVRPDVASVIVATSSGNFAATIERGLFAAWWPGRSDDRVAVHAYGRTGRELVRIDELECVTTPRVKPVGNDIVGGCPDGRPADDLPAVAPPSPELPSPLGTLERTVAVGRCRDPRVGRAADPASVVAAIVDARDAGRFVGVATVSSWWFCVEPATPDAFAPASRAMANLGGVTVPGPASPGEPLVMIEAKAPDGNMIDGNEVTWVWGRVDPAAATVVVSAPSGTFLATVEHGLFAAWWPGNDGDRTVVRALDADGREIAFVDQLNCGDEHGPHPRLVFGGRYVTGGCPAGHDLPPGTGGDDIPDPPAPPGS